MPLYAHRCPKCGKEFDEFYHVASPSRESTATCPGCGAVANRLMSPGKFKISVGHFFQPYIDEDITGEPIKIHSQQQFFNECEKAGKGYRKGPEKLL